MTSVPPNTPVTLTWQVLNAFSITAQQCAAFVQGSPAGAGVGNWTGVQAGTLTNGIYSGSARITPTANGTYTYALTCGGKQTGFATLVVSNPDSITTTALADASVGAPYSMTLAATGGVPPAMLWPDSTNRTASCRNSGVYCVRFAFPIFASLSPLKQLAKGYVFRGQDQSNPSLVNRDHQRDRNCERNFKSGCECDLHHRHWSVPDNRLLERLYGRWPHAEQRSRYNK
jgi:hypothetical protein